MYLTDPQNVKELVEMYQKKQQAIKSGESSSLGRPSTKGKAAAKQKMYCVSNPHKELLYGPFQLIRMHSCNTLGLDI